MPDARRSLNRAIAESRHPNYELHYLLSLVELRDGCNPRSMELKSRYAPIKKVLSDAYLMIGDYRQADTFLSAYIKKVRNKNELAELKERLEGIRMLAHSKPESSVTVPIVRPEVRRIPRYTITPEALLYRVEGLVRMEVLFGKNGKVEKALVVRGLGFGLDEEALRAVSAIEFKPGEVNGTPRSMWMGVQLHFGVIKIEIDDKLKKDSRIVRLMGSRSKTPISAHTSVKRSW